MRQRNAMGQMTTTHGEGSRGKRTKEYMAWLNMLTRCRNPKSNRWHTHGARGITVCDRWLSYESFLADMGRAPTKAHSIDRLDNDGNYEPSNCEWRTNTEQVRNSRKATQVEFDGETRCIVEWAEKTGISRFTISTRLSNGWTPERALTTPAARKSQEYRNRG